jgi:hypothetical protein
MTNVEKYDIIFCIFACATIKKYYDEILLINSTWGQYITNKKIKLLFFLGEEKTDLEGDNYVYLKNVSNDYESASHKQNLGLKHIYENYKFKFVFCCGTDNFINIYKLKKCLKRYNHKKKLYIGDEYEYRQLGDMNCFYFLGGGGFVLSYRCLKEVYPYLENLFKEWVDICTTTSNQYLCQNNYLISACDVAMGYILQKYIKPIQIKLNKQFFCCNYKGYAHNIKCCADTIDIKNIISCHYMEPNDFIDFDKILKENNYFLYEN